MKKSEPISEKNFKDRVPTLDLFDAMTLAEEIEQGAALGRKEITKTIRQLGQDDPKDPANNHILKAKQAFEMILEKPNFAYVQAAHALAHLEDAVQARNSTPTQPLTATNG